MEDITLLFILGIDGLEHDWVLKWNCDNLKQEYFGKIAVPIHSKKHHPYTPQVWGSFLTGVWLGNMDFERSYRVPSFLVSVVKALRKVIPISLGLGGKISPDIVGFPKLAQKTFVDHTDALTINAPFYDFDPVTFSIMRSFRDGKYSHSEALTLFSDHFQHLQEVIKAKCNPSNDIIFAYLQFADIFQHFLYPKMQPIKDHYFRMNDFVGELQELVDGYLLIVSDHGFDPNTESHSDYGYYSFNIPFFSPPQRITDFYEIILLYHTIMNNMGEL